MISKYHQGELAAQQRAGVTDEARRLSEIIQTRMMPMAQKFLAHQPFAIAASIDKDQRVWASFIEGEPGFIKPIDAETIAIETDLIAGDPLASNLQPDNQLGLLVIDLARRQRMRLNGHLLAPTVNQPAPLMTIRTTQVYVNCPKYIQARSWSRTERVLPTSFQTFDELTAAQQQLIGAADTFFIASAHPTAGADASHRGGLPGFIEVISSRTLRWPDYPGNNMLQTIGNISTQPATGLLLLDFDRGNTIQLTGKAEVIWQDPSTRSFEFQIERIIETSAATTLRWQLLDYSRYNPALSCNSPQLD